MRSSTRRLPFPLTGRRNTTTLASSTAVNATKTIPTRNKPLWDSLNQVKKKAYAQVNLSRLQLAIQSLESQTPTTRVAVLGLNVPSAARRLVRLLLADALIAEERWETQLLAEEFDPGQGLLIRYGESTDPTLQQSRQATPVLSIPAQVLQRNNLEILVSAVNAPVARGGFSNVTNTTSDAFLSPTVTTPSNATGRTTTINQPVHKSLLVSRDLNELVSAAELLASANFSSEAEAQMVDVVVDLEGTSGKLMNQTHTFDSTKAEAGLDAIRSSLEKATLYEHNWLESGMPELSKWLTLASNKGDAEMSIPVKNLMYSLLDSASATIERQASEAASIAEQNSITENTRKMLENAIAHFSYQAHAELQSGLAAAWSSRNWRKLAWYKLFWRVDDVSLIVTDLITNAWLPRTEKAVYEMSGRMLQAGIPSSDFEEIPAEVKVVRTVEPAVEVIPIPGSAGPTVALASTNHTATTFASIPGQQNIALQQTKPSPPRLATAVSTTRSNVISRAIAELTYAAQQIVLRTVTISGLSGALSGLCYFTITSGSVYESATIVALGTAFAMWRMQGEWQAQCRALENELGNEGRAVLKQTEEKMRRLVEQGSSRKEDEVEVKGRAEARAAVDRARQELRKLVG